MQVYERISVVVSLTLIGLALYFVLAFPNQTTAFTLFGTPLAISSLQQWLMALLLSVLAMAGTDAVIRLHPALPGRHPAYLATFWMLPGLLVLLATQTLGLAPNPVAWAVGLTGIGLILWLTILAEFDQIGTPDRKIHWSYLWQQFVGFGVALLFFIIIYRTRSRSALSATSITLMSGMVALSLLRYRYASLGKTWIFALVAGLSMGQITWALNYWRLNSLTAGLLLLLIFYGLIGLAQQQLRGQLSRRVLWEFGAVGTVLMVGIFYFA
jgi:hypothetical protein